MNQKILAEVPPQYSFWVCDGKVLKSIEQLHSALQQMTEDAYRFHANKEKNDFANWINDIIKDTKTAQKLRRAKSKYEAVKEIEKAIKTVKKTRK